MTLRHLIEDLREKSLLHLCCLLNESIRCSRSLGLTKDAEPLFYCVELVFEVLIQSSSGHLL